MDVSKLPRLSNTEPPANSESSPPQPVAPVQTEPASNPADVWISLAVGVIMLLMFPRFLQWVSSKLFHTNFVPFTMSDGTIVPYTQVPEFWGDLGPTLFAIVLIV